MRNFNQVDSIDIIEEYAYNNSLISSEEELSEKFDDEILPMVIEQYSEDDISAINEAFNNYSNSLWRDGEIHANQYDSYCYVGRLS
jgi:hypothetical protein